MNQKPRRPRRLLRPAVLAALLIAGSLILAGERERAAGEGPPAQEYVGSDVCKGCHADQAALLDKTVMGKIMLHFPKSADEKRGCEACHGPKSLHVGDPTNPAHQQRLFGKLGKGASPAKQSAVCITCHDKGERLYWKGGPHNRREVSCVKCHSVHKSPSAKNQLAAADEFELCGQCHIVRRAQLQRTSHMPMREGKMTCSDCHNPHGTATPKQIRENSVNELCYRCHAEKRGPFLWEHQPVKESCLNCHEPHGSIHDHLLRRKSERICQACHINTRHPGTPHAADARFGFNRACRNCHSTFHGSNHPSGRFFQR